mgnify:CR=1 FL=1
MQILYDVVKENREKVTENKESVFLNEEKAEYHAEPGIHKLPEMQESTKVESHKCRRSEEAIYVS